MCLEEINLFSHLKVEFSITPIIVDSVIQRTLPELKENTVYALLASSAGKCLRTVGVGLNLAFGWWGTLMTSFDSFDSTPVLEQDAARRSQNR